MALEEIRDLFAPPLRAPVAALRFRPEGFEEPAPAGAAPSGDGPYVKRVLRHSDVAALAERLPKLTQAEWAKLPGVSASRVPQLPAGAIIADAILDLLDVDQLELCPWALREGVILRRLDLLAQGLGARDSRSSRGLRPPARDLRRQWP